SATLDLRDHPALDGDLDVRVVARVVRGTRHDAVHRGVVTLMEWKELADRRRAADTLNRGGEHVTRDGRGLRPARRLFLRDVPRDVRALRVTDPYARGAAELLDELLVDQPPDLVGIGRAPLDEALIGCEEPASAIPLRGRAAPVIAAGFARVDRGVLGVFLEVSAQRGRLDLVLDPVVDHRAEPVGDLAPPVSRAPSLLRIPHAEVRPRQ